jgi:hypothetical protein
MVEHGMLVKNLGRGIEIYKEEGNEFVRKISCPHCMTETKVGRKR